MIVIFHPGFNPKAKPPTLPVADDVVAQFEGSEELCDRLVKMWSGSEKDFRVVARCDTRTEARNIIRKKKLRLLR